MTTALTHIALHVRNREESIRFYKDWCGMVDSSPGKDLKSPWLSSPGEEKTFALVLVSGAKEDRNQPRTDVTRMGFRIESKEELLCLYERAQGEDIVDRQFTQSPDGKRASFRIKDPNGYIVELWVGAMPALTRRFNNMSLHVSDMQASHEFYRTWAGLELAHVGRETLSCRLTTPGQDKPFQLVLCSDSACNDASCRAAPKSGDISHIGIAVQSIEELKDIYNRAVAKNIINWPLQERPFPAGTLFSIKDPDGNTVEFSYGQPLGDFGTHTPGVKP